MKVRTLNTVAGVVLVAASLTAVSAHAEGPYVGASLGTPNYPDRVNGVVGNSSGLSGKLFGGYQLTPNFAVEAGLANLGHIDERGGKVNGRSSYLDAVGIAPLGDKWALLGRLGVAHVNLDTTGGDSHGSGLKLGLGAQYSLSSSTALRAEWERYRPSVFGDKPNIDQYTVGLRVGF